MSFRFPLRVYWEDTDAGGIVYYANYLKFAERARTEALLGLGLRQSDLHARHGILFTVREARVTYFAPARLEDQLVVTTEIGAVGGARIAMAQEVRREATRLVACQVTLACVGADGRPARIPAEVRAAFGGAAPAGRG